MKKDGWYIHLIGRNKKINHGKCTPNIPVCLGGIRNLHGCTECMEHLCLSMIFVNFVAKMNHRRLKNHKKLKIGTDFF